MKNEELLKAFKKAHPNIVNLNPEITISETLESIGDKTNHELIVYDPPLISISIKHPFIFDHRLVPKEFNGIEVTNVIIGDFPSEFDIPDDAEILNTDYYHPEKYIKFVDRKLKTIARELKRVNLTKKEALDVLTGDLDAHLTRYNENKSNNN